MIRLLLMRHANALDGNKDHARSLSEVGLATARRVALELDNIGWLPDHVVASNATRCVETLDRMRDRFDPQAKVTIDQRLYLSGPETIGNIIRQNDDAKTLMVLAHNPGLSISASNWCGRYHSLSPASLVRLTIDAASFADASPADVVEHHHLHARDL